MSYVSEVVLEVMRDVVKEIKSGLCDVLAHTGAEPGFITTSVGKMKYFPYEAGYMRARLVHLESNTEVLKITRIFEGPTAFKDAQEYINVYFASGLNNCELRQIIESRPAFVGSEKVRIDSEDLLNMITLVKALTPGIIPDYVKRIETDITDEICGKIKRLGSVKESVDYRIGHAKRLHNLINK